jgi:hypothetical protein
MHPHTTTATTPASALAQRFPEELALTQLQGRATARVCYAPKTTPSGERAFGHFTLDATALAEAVGRTIAPHAFDPDSAPSADLTLHRWLSDHDSADAAPEEPPAALPPTWPGLAPIIEALLDSAHTRIFCTCCNRNLAAPAVRRTRAPRHATSVATRYLCPRGHLLLDTPATQILAASAAHAA